MARRDRLMRQALDQTDLRYGPEKRGLKALMAELRSDLVLDIRSEEGAAAGIKSAIKHVRPQVQRVYENAGMSYQQADADLAAAGATSDASSREAAGAKRRLAESLADAQTELGQRQVDAEAGRAFGVRQAKATYKTEAGKVRGQARDLAGEAGLYASTTYQDLSQADRKYRLESNTARRAARALEADITGVDPKTGQKTAAQEDREHDNRLADEEAARLRDKENKPKPPSREAISKHQDLVASIQDARKDAAALRRSGVPWSDIQTVLQSSKSEKNPYGGHKGLLAGVGIELARGGSLRQPTVRQLRARGLLPGRMPSGWRRTWKDDAREGAGNLTDLGI